MAYAERRGGKLTGRWYADVELKPKGKPPERFRKAFDTKAEADGYEAYVRATGQEPPHAVSRPTNSLRDVAVRFQAAEPQWGRRDPLSIQRLDWWIGRIGDMDISHITTEDLDKQVAFLSRLPGKKRGTLMGNATINRYLHALSAVLTWAHQRRLLEHKPYVPVRAAKSERLLTVPEDLEDTLLQWIEGNCGTPNAAFVIRVLIETGLRRSELWKLRPDQVTWEQDENQDEHGWLTLEPEQTKTDEARLVWVPADMARKLKGLVQGNALPKAYRVYRIFKRAVKACGANADLTLHSLRHTRATRMLGSGVDSLIVAKSLGHRSLATTKKYVHPGKAVLAEAAKKVAPPRGKQPEKGTLLQFAHKENVA